MTSRRFSIPVIKNPITVLIIVLAITLQIQVTLFSSENYEGLRVNLTDLLIPFLGIFILISLFLKKTTYPVFHVKYATQWLIVLEVTLLAAAYKGYQSYGEFIQWAWVNKTLGWFILCSYFLLGGWLAQQINRNHLILFIRAFLSFFLLVTWTEITEKILFYSSIIDNTYFSKFPASGLMANKNTYTFFFLTLLALSINFYKKIPSNFLYLLIFTSPFLLAFTGGRTLIIILPILLTILFLFNRKADWKKFFLCLLAGSLIFAAFYNIKTKPIASFHPQNYEIFIAAKEFKTEKDITSLTQKTSYPGDTNRIKVLSTSLEIIKKNPIQGAGLGSIQKEQVTQWGIYMNILDNTALWLWAETGLVGLLLFLTFYGLCLKTLYRNGFNKDNDETARNLNKSVLIILLIFGFMSLFHELLYTRFMWFFMGLALAYPLKPSAQPQN